MPQIPKPTVVSLHYAASLFPGAQGHWWGAGAGSSFRMNVMWVPHPGNLSEDTAASFLETLSHPWTGLPEKPRGCHRRWSEEGSTSWSPGCSTLHGAFSLSTEGLNSKFSRDSGFFSGTSHWQKLLTAVSLGTRNSRRPVGCFSAAAQAQGAPRPRPSAWGVQACAHTPWACPTTV